MSQAMGSRTLRELSRVVFLRFWMVLAIVVIVTVGTWVACVVSQKSYAASVMFLAKEPRPPGALERNVSVDRSLEVFIKTQHELIMSETVMNRTALLFLARSAELYPDDPAYTSFKEYVPLAERWESARDAWLTGDGVETWGPFHDTLVALDAAVEKQMSDPDVGRQFARKAADFANRVSMETPGGERVSLSEVFTVSVVQPGTPFQAKLAADLLARNYMDRYREVQERSGSSSAVFMHRHLERIRTQRVSPAEARLNEFIQTLGAPADVNHLEQLSKTGGEVGKAIVVRRFEEDIIDLEGQIARARQLRRQILEQLPDVLWEGGERVRDERGDLAVPSLARLSEAQLPDDDPALEGLVVIVPDETLTTNPVLGQLKSKEVDLVVRLNRLVIEYQPDYRGVVDMKAEIASTRRQILKELIGESAALSIEIAMLEAQRDELTRRVTTEKERLDRLSLQLVRYQELQSEVELARQEYRKASMELADALKFQKQESNAITLQIIDDAKLPDASRPAFPNTLIYTLLAALVGLMLALSYAFLADYFDHTLHSIEETERYLGVPVVGSVGRHGRGLVR